MKKNKKLLSIIAVTVLIGLVMIFGLSEKSLLGFSTVTKAEKNTQLENLGSGMTFAELNQLAQNHNNAPSITGSKDLIEKALETVSVIELPAAEKSQIVDQVAAGFTNGSSNIQEANIVVAVNDLAARSNAPAYAYTADDQVEVTRKYLNRLAPDLVSANGGMNDIEAFIVFAALVSQKIDNEDFMVTPAEFTNTLNNPNEQEIPGRPETIGEVTISQESPKTYEMLDVISNYLGSKSLLSSNDTIALIGIQ